MSGVLFFTILFGISLGLNLIPKVSNLAQKILIYSSTSIAFNFPFRFIIETLLDLTITSIHTILTPFNQRRALDDIFDFSFALSLLFLLSVLTALIYGVFWILLQVNLKEIPPWISQLTSGMNVRKHAIIFYLSSFVLLRLLIAINISIYPVVKTSTTTMICLVSFSLSFLLTLFVKYYDSWFQYLQSVILESTLVILAISTFILEINDTRMKLLSDMVIYSFLAC